MSLGIFGFHLVVGPSNCPLGAFPPQGVKRNVSRKAIRRAHVLPPRDTYTNDVRFEPKSLCLDSILSEDYY